MKKVKLLLCLALVLSGGLLGCSTVSRQARETSNPNSSSLPDSFGEFDPSSAPFTMANTNFDDDISNLYSIEGEVTKITKADFLLQSITVQFIKDLPTAKGTLAPFDFGDTIVIYFYEPLAKLRSLRLTTGSEIRLSLIEFELASHHIMPGGRRAISSDGALTDMEYVWRGDFSSLAVEKNGNFYDRNGEKVKWNLEP
jgi:hypothetical protein